MGAAMLTLQSIARALGGEINGVQVLVPGPGHSSADRSLSVKLSSSSADGFIVHSHAGDDPIRCKDYVREQLGLPAFKPNGHAERTISYDYRDASGAVRYRKKRIERADGSKTFAIEPKDRGGSAPLLYGAERLADLGEGQSVFVVEGEKKVDRLRELGAIAVCADSRSSSKWRPLHAKLLRGLPIILWPDSDEPGETYIANAAAAIRADDASADIRITRPFGFPNGSKGLDVCDWTGNAEALAKLAKSAEPFTLSPRQGPRFTAKAWTWRDPTTIQPRQFLYGKHLIRKYPSATVAPGGLGRSSLTLVEALEMVSGRPLLCVAMRTGLKVWYYNLEDPRDEIERRIAAVMLHYKIEPDAIDGRLFINSGRDEPLIIGEKARDSTVIHKPVIDAITAEIRERGIDVLIIDPFVSCHRVPENDNGAIDAITKAWSQIADEANCAIELIHHVRKPGGGVSAEFTVDDARGASALIAAVRSVRVLNIMSKEEAEAAGVEERYRRAHFRIDNGKANLAPPMEKAEWRKFVSVPLGNGTADEAGDSIGVVTMANAQRVRWHYNSGLASRPKENCHGRMARRHALKKMGWGSGRGSS
jgi:hypothetical protein